MKIEKFIPSDKLKPFIKNFIIVESIETETNKILPGTSLVLAFRIKGTSYAGDRLSTLPTSAIAGLTKAPRILNYSNNTAIILTLFKEGGASVFFKHPMHELYEEHISLDNLINKNLIAQVEDSLFEIKNNKQMISIVEKFLLSNLNNSKIDISIQKAVQNIKQSNGNIRIKELASSINTSIDVLEKKFRRIIGTSPKQFSTIVRFENVLKNYNKGQSLTDIAYNANYFDQSHFIKEFKIFTGQSPRKFFS